MYRAEALCQANHIRIDPDDPVVNFWCSNCGWCMTLSDLPNNDIGTVKGTLQAFRAHFGTSELPEPSIFRVMEAERYPFEVFHSARTVKPEAAE